MAHADRRGDDRRADRGGSESDLADVVARVRVAGDARPDSAPVRLSSSGAVVDNVVVNPAAADAASLVPVPEAGALLDSEEFSDPSLAGFTWVRRNPAVTVSDGSLRWPVEGTDLVGGGNTASVLLHDTPGDGDWIAEAKTTLDLGVDTVRNYQQVGLVAYENDDDFARLSNVAIWNTRQTEFGRETAADPNAAPGPGVPTSYGGAVIGTSAPTLWLRLARPPERRRRAPLPRRHEPGRRALDVGRDVDLPRRAPTRASGCRARRRQPRGHRRGRTICASTRRAGRTARAQDETHPHCPDHPDRADPCPRRRAPRGCGGRPRPLPETS